MGFFIDGILASEHLDSSGESLSVAGCDLSSIHRGEGIVNFEHKSESPLQCLGKILSAKKIFSEKDCENDREKYYWNKCKCPYIYILCELFDSEVGNHVASMFKYSSDHPNTGNVLGFSIEGSKLKKEGPNILGSIARKATLTAAPCNKSCIAEMVPGEEQKSEDSIFKSEPSFVIELVQRSKGKYRENFQIETLSKAEVPGSKFPASQPAKAQSKPVKGAPGWQHTGGGNFSHPEHGVVSVVKEGPQFNVKHGGGLAGIGGKKGSFGTAQEAGAHAGNYIRSLGQGKTQAPKMHNRPSPNMDKSIVGGMMGAGLPQESTDKKNKRGLFNPDVDKIQGSGAIVGGGMAKGGEKSPKISQVRQKGTFSQKGVHMPPLLQAGGGESVMGSHVRNPSDTGSGSKEMARRHAQSNLKELKQMPKPKLAASEKAGNLKKAMSAGSGMASPGSLTGGAALAPESLDRKMKKTQWLTRAEEAYKVWGKREAFEGFMAKHLPNLTKSEIHVIGATLALRKSMRAEKKLAKMVTDKGQDSYVEKKEK